MPITAVQALVALGTALTVDGYFKGEESRKEAKEAQGRSRVAQEKTQSEQRANNAARQAEMQRKTYREERVRRARIMQSAENTGVAGSSGEYGALGNLETQLSTTLGNQIGDAATKDRMSGYAQEGANAQFDFQNAQQNMSSASSQINLGMNLFGTGLSIKTPAGTPTKSSSPSSTGGPDSNLNLLM